MVGGIHEGRMTMSNNSMKDDARRTESPETIDAGVAHVEIELGEPTETAGRG